MSNIKERTNGYGEATLHLIVNALVLGGGIAESLISNYISPWLLIGFAEMPLTLSKIVKAIRRSGQNHQKKF